MQPQGQGKEPDIKRGEHRDKAQESRGPHPRYRPLREEGNSSYLRGIEMGDPAASPRLKKAARTLTVSSRRPSSSEPAMGAPVKEGAGGWSPGLT